MPVPLFDPTKGLVYCSADLPWTAIYTASILLPMRTAIFMIAGLILLSGCSQRDAKIGSAQATMPLGPITLISSSARSDSPKGLMLEAVFNSELPIRDAKLRYQMNRRQQIADAEPLITRNGQITTMISGIDMTNKGPGQLVEYWYAVFTEAGQVIESPHETSRYVDSRFRWQEIREGDVSVAYHQNSSS